MTIKGLRRFNQTYSKINGRKSLRIQKNKLLPQILVLSNCVVEFICKNNWSLLKAK